MRYAFDEADAADRRVTQYFEMFCNRGIYHEGWAAVTRHSIPWLMAPELPSFDDDVWELYDTSTDWSQARDLAAEHPDKLEELQARFLEEARKYGVLPLDDRRVERFNADLAGRPTLIKGNSQILFGGMGRLTENVLLNVKNKSHAVTAEVVVPEGGADGVIFAQGGEFGGWSLYFTDGVPRYCYNLFGLQRFKVLGSEPVPAGTHQVRMEFAYDGGGLAKGGTVSLYVDGEHLGQGRVEATTADDVLRRRDRRRRTRHRALPSATTTRATERLLRHGQLGADRSRRGRRGRRPPDHSGGAAARRDGPPVSSGMTTRALR